MPLFTAHIPVQALNPGPKRVKMTRGVIPAGHFYSLFRERADSGRHFRGSVRWHGRCNTVSEMTNRRINDETE
ncbi:hypothetical protein SedNR2807_38880 [Citrobacter sedlakii]